MSVEKLLEALGGVRVVELGRALEEGMPAHPSHPRFYRMQWHSKAAGDICNDYQLLLSEHSGTHVDSFGHYIAEPGYELIDEIDVRRFCCPCVTIDATDLGPRETLGRERIRAFEAAHGGIRPGDGVLIDTGWMRYWAVRPAGDAFCREFPGLSAEGAEYLVQRGVNLVGIDTLSIDAWGAQGDPAHHTLLSNRVLVAENLNNLEKLHGRRGVFAMLPLLVRGGTASPVRPVALLNRE